MRKYILMTFCSVMCLSFLTAPLFGVECKKKSAGEKVDQVLEKTKETYDKVKEKVKDGYDKAKEKTQEAYEKLKDTFGDKKKEKKKSKK